MSDANFGSIASVILDQAINMTLDYKICPKLIGHIYIGSRVKVSLQGSIRLATVIEIKQSSQVQKLREITELLDTPILPKDLVILAKWMAHYYCCPLRKVLQMILPPSVRIDTGAKQQLFVKPLLDKAKLKELCEQLRLVSHSQAEVVSILLQAPKGLLLSELMEKAHVSRSPINTLMKKNILSCSPIEIDRSSLLEWEFFMTKPKPLNTEQTEALTLIKQSVNTNQFHTHLLHGVTGSGKTEVYLQAIQHTLEQGKSVIFLVPEIALTSQTIERLRGRFTQKLAVLHYRLSPGEKRDAWHSIAANLTPITIGARSAVFSPANKLGLLIVDEEHESSYKQTEDSPRYHARDIAVMRGKLNQATVILGSATPSLESYQNTLLGKYHLHILSKRADKATLPEVHLVDMRPQYQKAKGFTLFSEILIEKMKQKITRGEQVLLFLNRRGYHTAQLCLNCSYIISCPHCDISLTFSLQENQLSCHLCNFSLSPPPKSCPKCHAEGQFKFKGVGTELVERSLKALLPEARALRIDRDTTRHKGSHELLLKQFRTGKADVLIGTQMIAKGLHFPLVTLVGVLMADSNLQIPDFRASENTFQLLTQVAGRSGRGALSGEVVIQTLLPEHTILSLAKQQNFEGFFAQEIKTRQLFCYPPFTRLAKLIFSGKIEQQVINHAEKVQKNLMTKLSHSEVLPLIACGHARIKGVFRYQFLIKTKNVSSILPQLHQLQQHKEIKLSIDIDPLSTFF